MWIDEGYYDFRWMSDVWNWIIYFLYTTVITFIASAFYRIAFRNSNPHPWKTGVAVVIGFLSMTVLLLGLWELR